MKIFKFEQYTDFFDEFSFTEIKDELEESFTVSSISQQHLQDKILGPRKIKAFKILEQKTDALMVFTCFQWVMHDLHSEILKLI